MRGYVNKVMLMLPLVVLMLVLYPDVATARDRAVVMSEFQQAFEEMYAHPGDVDATLKYSSLAVELEDYEAAVSPLERILMMNPNLPEIRLEVGVLYFLMNSFDTAKMHLELVREDATATDAQKTRAVDYLSKINKK
jgi:tetratricopeptide (TPR) repeat protein